MKRLTNLYYFLILTGLSPFFTTCKKDAAQPVYSSCVLTRLNNYDFHYNAAGIVTSYSYPPVNTHVQSSSTMYDYQPDGSVLISYPYIYWQEFYVVDVDSLRRPVYMVHSTQYDPTNSYGPNGLINSAELSYDPGGKKVVIVFRDGKDTGNTVAHVCTFNNDTEVVHADCYDKNGMLIKKVDLAYDNHINPARFFFAPTAFDDYGPYFPPKHNLTKITTTLISNTGTSTTSVSSIAFTYTASGYPDTRTRGNGYTDKYNYQCK